jgi:hypothetical protein
MAHLYPLTIGKHGHPSFAMQWASLKSEADGFMAHYPSAGWSREQGDQIANLYNMVVTLAKLVHNEKFGNQR